MFKNYIASIVVFFISFFPAKGKDLSSYYAHVYQAEKFIVEQDYHKASLEYDSAFAFYPTSFACDIYNATRCLLNEYDSNNNDRIALLCKKLIEKGADLSFFRKQIFTVFRNSPACKRLEKEYPVLAKKRDTKLKRNLLKEIERLNTIDQAVHCMLPSNAKDAAFIKRMNSVNDTISVSLSQLMKKYDYLSEDIIGANFHDTILSIEPVYGILVLHEFQKNGSLLRGLINEAIHSGKVKAEVGLRWLENGMTTKIRFTGDYMIYKNVLYRHKIDYSFHSRWDDIVRLLSPSPTKEAISNKLYYYVDSPDNIVSKMVYNMKNIDVNDPFLFCIGLKRIMSLAMPEEDFIKNLEVVYDNNLHR